MEGGESESASWELAKENIQPLKQGRKMAKLTNVLQPRDHEESFRLLQEERQEFEMEIRSYSGPDPLDTWYRYITWIEQSYPKGGKEGSLHVVLEKCIKQFKDEREAHRDPRFLEVWLRYASMSQQPLDVYEFMYKNGMCSQQVGLYDAWAWHLETQNSFQSAEKVFTRGLGALTDKESKVALEGRRHQFQTRVFRRMKGEEIPAEEIEEQEQRSALGRLKGHGRHGKVGTVRVGGVKLGGPGTLTVAGSLKQPLKPKNSMGGSKIQVYQDENGPVALGIAPARRTAASIPVAADRKENEMEAGRWSETRGSKQHNIPLNKISQHAKQAFTVHEDESADQYKVAPHRLAPGESNVLSARKLDKEDVGLLQCPVALFEPADPTKRPMYCKNKVYQGATEFSFEEMRAVSWRNKEKARLEVEEIERKKWELLEREEIIKKKEEEVARQMEEFRRMMASQSGLRNQPEILVTLPSTSSDSLLSDSQPRFSNSFVGRSSENTFSSNSNSVKMDDTVGLLNANPSGSKSHPSPTVNTKEAMAVMQKLWSKPVEFEDEEENDEVFVPKYEMRPPVVPKPKFEIFTDDPQPVQALYQPPAPAPFAIFCDDENSAPSSDRLNRKQRSANINFEDKENQIIEGENEENQPPPGYAQPPRGSRPLVGVLAEAINVDFLPLEEQERLLDAEEKKAEEEEAAVFAIPRPVMASCAGNATMMVPDLDEFEKMAKISSTPFTGRGFVPDEDDDTCAVELVLRKEAPLLISNRPPQPEFAAPSTTTADSQAAASVQACLSPIVETSREHYKSSSSSSSGVDTTHGVTRNEHSKSHWGNTVANSTHFKTSDNTLGFGPGLGVRTPGHTLGYTNASGYMGDRSSMSSNVKPTAPYSKLEDLQELGRKLDIVEDDQTEMLPDMMSEYRQNIKTDQDLQQSFQPSFLEVGTRDRTGGCSMATSPPVSPELREVCGLSKLGLGKSANPTTGLNLTGTVSPNMNGASCPSTTGAPGFNMTGAPSLSTTGAPQLNMTGAPQLSTTGASQLNMTGAPQLNITGAPCLSTTDAPQLNMTGAPQLNMTGAPQLNITGAPQLSTTRPPQLNITGAPHLNMTGPLQLNVTGAQSLSTIAAPQLNSTGAPSLNMTGAPSLGATRDPLSNFATPASGHPTLDLTAAEDGNNQGSVVDNLDPFSPDLHKHLLSGLAVPLETRHGFIKIPSKMPNVRVKSVVHLAEDTFFVSELKGEGGFAKVFAAKKEGCDMNSTIAGIDAVLKVQKPANDWEWYISIEVDQRLRNIQYHHLLSGFMSIPRNYSFSDGGIFVSYHQQMGSVLDIANIIKSYKHLTESGAMFWVIEMLSLVEALHSAGVVHADIKADNFLLQSLPSLNVEAVTVEEMFPEKRETTLQLIDFGRAIDLRLLPENVAFSQVVKTQGLTCVEMREGRAWREHIDYYGLAATAYLLLFYSYMDIVKTDSGWEVKGSFKRWWQVDLWKQFFREFLNIQENQFPSLAGWRKQFERIFFEKGMAEKLKDLRKAAATSR